MTNQVLDYSQVDKPDFVVQICRFWRETSLDYSAGEADLRVSLAAGEKELEADYSQVQKPDFVVQIRRFWGETRLDYSAGEVDLRVAVAAGEEEFGAVDDVCPAEDCHRHPLLRERVCV